jgi:acetoin utilization deacetylase AcuC-like enzyme
VLKIAFSPVYAHSLPEGHRFPMEKYELLPEQLLYEGSVEPCNFFEPASVSPAAVLRVHTQTYYDALQQQTLDAKAIRRLGFPLSPELVHREHIITQGTIDCAKFALQYGLAMNIAGGTHHAFAERGEGFCLFNDFAVAAQHLLDHQLAKKILIIDLDVHQGNGTAKIFENEAQVFTFSMHGAHNYPIQKEQSDWDIPLPDKCNDSTYLAYLAEALPLLWQRVKPDFVCFLSGVDVLATDKLGRLGMTTDGCKTRDKMVFEWCFAHNLPVIVSMGGGYSVRIADIVDAHANTFRLANHVYF